MPNYVTNIIRFQGSAEQVEMMRAAVQDDKYGRNGIDFNKIIPMPKDLYMGDLGTAERERYGAHNWYDWSRANWGTKWNAFRFDDAPDDYMPDRIVFITANGAPHPVLQKLSELYPDITMHHQWADDDIGVNCGERTYKGGQIIDEYMPDYGRRSVEFACAVKETLPEDYGLVLNADGTEYVYGEEQEAAAMEIKTITTDDLRRMPDWEGLILQGCGGDPQEWIDGINQMLTEEGILLEGSKFQNCAVFQNENLTCILYPIDDDVKLDMGKLAMWRLRTHANFGGTWLSDYVPNQLDGFIREEPTVRQKPDCPLIGQDGNIYNLVGIAARTLRESGMQEEAKEMTQRVFCSDSYGAALGVIGEYVNITSLDEMEDDLDDEFDEEADLEEEDFYQGMNMI